MKEKKTEIYFLVGTNVVLYYFFFQLTLFLDRPSYILTFNQHSNSFTRYSIQCIGVRLKMIFFNVRVLLYVVFRIYLFFPLLFFECFKSQMIIFVSSSSLFLFNVLNCRLCFLKNQFNFINLYSNNVLHRIDKK